MDWQNLRESYRRWKLARDIKAGRVLRGRQPREGGPGAVKAKSEPKVSIKARIYHAATDTWEEL